MTRAGLNGTLLYKYAGVTNMYKVRVFAYDWNYTQIAEDGANARTSRAYYPHRVTIDQFSITLQLKGYAEWRDFNVWMTTYAKNLNKSTMQNSGSTPTMTVILAGRNWSRVGIPTQGYGFGNHLGAIMWQPQIVFDAANDPFDKNPNAVQISKYNDTSAVFQDTVNAPYFYPFSQFAGGDTDSGVYDQLVEANSSSSGYIDNAAVSSVVANSNSVSTSSSSGVDDSTADAGIDPSYGTPSTDAASSTEIDP